LYPHVVGLHWFMSMAVIEDPRMALTNMIELLGDLLPPVARIFGRA
jgi:hypothetical protein